MTPFYSFNELARGDGQSYESRASLVFRPFLFLELNSQS